jgi:16S rRNA (guanine527-N7)-methyltransferase
VNAASPALDTAQQAQLSEYLRLLLDANMRLNLTAISDPAEAEQRLIGESLALLELIPDDAQALIDIGSGGGIPGLPLAIARPHMTVTLLDATRKKVDFLRATADALRLPNITTLNGRAEELSHDRSQRERYDVATARAVARLAVLVELTLPFVRVGGRVLLPKGAAAADELAEAGEAIRILGGRGELQLIGQNGPHIVVVEKLRPTPTGYPRRTGLPHKRPIGVPAR